MKVGQRILLLLCLLPWAMVAFAHARDWTARVYKLVVTHADGTTELGSTVPLGGERLVTNCHVLHRAARIEVLLDDTIRQVLADQRDAYRDMCFLTLPGHRAAPMPMIDVGETRVGLEVMAVGYPAGKFAIGEGRIILDSSVERARVCGFRVVWQGALSCQCAQRAGARKEEQRS